MLAVDAAELGIDCEICQCRNGVSDQVWRIKDLQWQSNVCPKLQVTPWSWYMLQLFNGYRDGHLPMAGGMIDQPFKFLQAFNIIAARQAENARKKVNRGKKTPR
jgi:hypothetical protein